MASITRSTFASGSPIPWKTTPCTRSPAARAWPRTRRTCSTISHASRLRASPSRPVAQNAHASAHPACELTHALKRPARSSGMRTASMTWPSAVASASFTNGSTALRPDRAHLERGHVAPARDGRHRLRRTSRTPLAARRCARPGAPPRRPSAPRPAVMPRASASALGREGLKGEHALPLPRGVLSCSRVRAELRRTRRAAHRGRGGPRPQGDAALPAQGGAARGAAAAHGVRHARPRAASTRCCAARGSARTSPRSGASPLRAGGAREHHDRPSGAPPTAWGSGTSRRAPMPPRRRSAASPSAPRSRGRRRAPRRPRRHPFARPRPFPWWRPRSFDRSGARVPQRGRRLLRRAARGRDGLRGSAPASPLAEDALYARGEDGAPSTEAPP